MSRRQRIASIEAQLDSLESAIQKLARADVFDLKDLSARSPSPDLTTVWPKAAYRGENVLDKIGTATFNLKNSRNKESAVFTKNKDLISGDIRVKYMVKSNSGGVLVALYHGSKRIGLADAYTSSARDNKCQSDIDTLVEAYPEVIDKWGKPQILRTMGSQILEEYRGKRIGLAMYLAIAKEWFEENGPFIFIPSECGSVGSTSSDARRVWASLARVLPSSGNALAILSRPRVPADL